MKYVVKAYHDQTIAKYKRTLFGFGKTIKVYYFNEGKTNIVYKAPYNKADLAKLEREMENQMAAFVQENKDILERNTILEQKGNIDAKKLKSFDSDIQKYALYISAKDQFHVTKEEKKIAGLKEPKFNVNTIDKASYTELIEEINYLQKIRSIIAYNKKNIFTNTNVANSKVKTK